MKHGLLLLCLRLSAIPLRAQAPDLGPNVSIFSPSTPPETIQREVDRIYALQQHNEFGPERHAFLFLPGTYRVDLPLGFYTEVAGLGAQPDDTLLRGNFHVDAAGRNNNATTTFWRGAENLSVAPASGVMRWAVSQAVPMRRLHVRGDLVLHQDRGWASGGWIADTLIDGNVDSGTQQQWISRNTEWRSWTGSNWNMVFVGDPQAPAGDWPKPAYTKVAQTPIAIEKPFLVARDAKHWSLVVPAATRNTAGVSWVQAKAPAARTIPFSRVYVARPERDSAASLNAQLAAGKHLVLTPGVYELAEPLRVTHPGTVVLGLGFATLKPTQGTATIETADVDGLRVSSLLIDAGEQTSPVLVQVGPRGSKASHARDPIALHDVFFRVGGAGPGRAETNLEINSRSTVLDHTWIWRADHGRGAGWETNPSRTGLAVNADDVLAYGLFVEHHQGFQVDWRGERGRTYMYQSEIPYDPPSQAAYTSAPGVNGWASYKVADTVTQHEAWGLGVYSVFTHPDIFLSHAIETPEASRIHFHHMVTVCLLTHGGMRHIVNEAGDPTKCAPGRIDPRLAEFPTPATK